MDVESSLTFSTSAALASATSFSWASRSSLRFWSRSRSRATPTMTFSRWMSLLFTPLAPGLTRTSKIRSSDSEGKVKPHSPLAYCSISFLLSAPSLSLSYFLKAARPWSICACAAILFSFFAFSVLTVTMVLFTSALAIVSLCWSRGRVGFFFSSAPSSFALSSGFFAGTMVLRETVSAARLVVTNSWAALVVSCASASFAVTSLAAVATSSTFLNFSLALNFSAACLRASAEDSAAATSSSSSPRSFSATSCASFFFFSSSARFSSIFFFCSCSAATRVLACSKHLVLSSLMAVFWPPQFSSSLSRMMCISASRDSKSSAFAVRNFWKTARMAATARRSSRICSCCFLICSRRLACSSFCFLAASSACFLCSSCFFRCSSRRFLLFSSAWRRCSCCRIISCCLASAAPLRRMPPPDWEGAPAPTGCCLPPPPPL
mmetsp:Transcript_69494/g.155622  ORF Transcript_69494/g.155622 Transcript_69494/m.155622 type:complete len:435 (-) Transcript_69494:404-1708(-)